LKRQTTDLNILLKNCSTCGKKLLNPIAAVKNQPKKLTRLGLRREMIVIQSVKMMKRRGGAISRSKIQLSKNQIGLPEMAFELHHQCVAFYPILISGLFNNVRNFVESDTDV
jgi:hypothetical protein